MGTLPYPTLGVRSEHWVWYPTLPYPQPHPTLPYPTLPNPTELKWKVGVKWGLGVNIWWGTLPYRTLPYGVQVGYSTVQEMKCGGGGEGVRSEHWVGTLPYPTLGGRSEHWVWYPTLTYYPTLPHPTTPQPTLPYPTLSYPTIPYPTLP